MALKRMVLAGTLGLYGCLEYQDIPSPDKVIPSSDKVLGHTEHYERFTTETDAIYGGWSLDFEHFDDKPINILIAQGNFDDTRSLYTLLYEDTSGNDLKLESVSLEDKLESVSLEDKLESVSLEEDSPGGRSSRFTYDSTVPEDKPYVDAAQKQFDAFLGNILAVKDAQYFFQKQDKEKAGQTLFKEVGVPGAVH